MDGQASSIAAYAAIGSGVFWLLYLGLVLVEYTGKVPYSTAFKTLGLPAGLLQALPIIVPAAVLYEVFDYGASALNLAGFDRPTLLTHVHAGTLGWITLSLFRASDMFFSGEEPASRAQAAYVRWLSTGAIAAM